MKDLFMRTILALTIISILGIFAGFIVWIWIGSVGAKISLTSFILTFIFGAFGCLSEEF